MGAQAGWSARLPDMAFAVAIEPGSEGVQGSMARRAPARGRTPAGADQRSARAHAGSISGAAPASARSEHRRLAPDRAGHVGAEAGAVARRARLAIGRGVRIGDRLLEAISTARRDVYMIGERVRTVLRLAGDPVRAFNCAWGDGTDVLLGGWVAPAGARPGLAGSGGGSPGGGAGEVVPCAEAGREAWRSTGSGGGGRAA